MADLDITSTSTTTLNTSVDDFSVAHGKIDVAESDEFWHDFPKSDEYLGYYKSIPELKKATDLLATWVVGKGAEVMNGIDKAILEHIVGWGEDNFIQVLWNMVVQKKIFGDAFAEIVTDGKKLSEGGILLNLKPIYTGHMRVYVNGKGIITKYEQRVLGTKNYKKFDVDEIFHISNDRIGNEIHGTSVIEACKWVIDARNEAMSDTRKIMHRDLAMGVLEVDTDKDTQINSITSKYADAVKNGEVLVLPKGTAELKDSPVRSHQDRLDWIRYLENFFYQAVGIPRVIASSQEYSEASSKVGYLTFEPIYTFEQTLLEADLWNQMGIKIVFNRPPSLSGLMESSEAKNTGQTGFQQSEIQPSVTKNE